MSSLLRPLAASAACAALACAGLAACGSMDDAAVTSVADGGPDSSGPRGPDAGFGSDASPSAIAANGIVIVHAASFGAFRLCFGSALERRPIPEAELMPESNVPGIDVGSAVRIDPLLKPPGQIWAFAVDDITSSYPPGQPGLDCKTLLEGKLADKGVEVGNVDDDLATGVHLLVLRGSVPDGGLRIQKITLSAFARGPKSSLPVQVVPLSSDLSDRAGERSIGVAFGDLFDAAPPDPFVEGELPFGEPAPAVPAVLSYDPDDDGAYAATGFFVSLGDLDGGAREVLLAQSLADVQRLSAPRALPGPWYAEASSYALLLLGGADADSGAPDGSVDERSMLHILAVPVAAPPRVDAGDAGAAPSDASSE